MQVAFIAPLKIKPHSARGNALFRQSSKKNSRYWFLAKAAVLMGLHTVNLGKSFVGSFSDSCTGEVVPLLASKYGFAPE